MSIADINEDNGTKVVTDLSKMFSQENIQYIKCDVTDEHSFRHVFSETIAKFGRLDIVFNNAGTGDESKWSKMVDINFVRSKCYKILLLARLYFLYIK